MAPNRSQISGHFNFLYRIIFNLLIFLFQEILRVHFIQTYGLKRLKFILEQSEALPLVIQRILLTLSCSDFEEISKTGMEKF